MKNAVKLPIEINILAGMRARGEVTTRKNESKSRRVVYARLESFDFIQRMNENKRFVNFRITPEGRNIVRTWANMQAGRTLTSSQMTRFLDECAILT